jgi:hypothetical protein
MKNIRAKFEVIDLLGEDKSTVVLEPRYDETLPEDQRFCDATPWGRFEMFVNNPAALEQLQIGRKFYLDLIPVEGGNG